MAEDRADRQATAGGGLRGLPSVDGALAWPEIRALAGGHGLTAAKSALRQSVETARARLRAGEAFDLRAAIVADAGALLAARSAPALRPVFNLTGTVIHTNLGRAPLAPEAVAEMCAAAATPVDLEFDLASGRRGDRDTHLEAQICRLTGAEAATVVNNNAAAVLLVLNTLARGKEVVVSRGELVEIGGAFRIPDVMQRAGARLREVGTTNRTHARDYAEAAGGRTALVMKVHTSNYAVRGFVASVPERELAQIAQAHGVPFVVDLGSGMLVDLEAYGLPHEPTVRETLAAGADLVTFSGDKLLGGPQAGVIAGRADLVARVRKNPMKRALRLDKLVIAALSATLRLYEDPDRLRARLPVLRLLTRPLDEIEALAARVAPGVARVLEGRAAVETVACRSQIGSGALPVDLLPSVALSLRPARGTGGAVDRLAAAFRALPVPVVGRVADGALHFDLRCLEDEAGFLAQLDGLQLPGRTAP